VAIEHDLGMRLRTRGRIYLSGYHLLKRFRGRPQILARLIGRAQSTWGAVWLGLLEAEDLNAVTWASYDANSGFGTEDFNLHQGLWPWELDAIRNHLGSCDNVLVAGAGGGREVVALLRFGHGVTAFDSSPSLAAACRRNIECAGLSARVLDAPPGGVPDGLGIHDGLLIGRGVYHHIVGRRERVAFLKACKASIAVGSPILVSDFFTRKSGASFHARNRTIADFLRRMRGSDERVELGDWLTDCVQHAFTQDEFERELVDAGIQPETYAVSPMSESSQLAHAFGRAS
jgi:hypothetical protein